ncbi:MAG TPA: T9SS type A sorting domain-containing protein, partial [Tenuifilaceae bacterium]|nr:T9SS type A sorting domain-containing protein [Tenuifilaceae bacterium]
SRIFDYSLSYKKGASLVHMIRHEINNDEVFFNVLKTFLNRYAHSTATGNDFLNVLNEVTQSNYQWFFDQWYYGFGYPIYKFEYSIQGNTLNIKVMHNGSSYLTTLFKTSMEVVATTQSGVETQRIFVSENEQSFNLTFSNPVKSVEFDPNNWILKQTESVTSVNEINSNIDVTITPNPASNSITITMPSNTSMFSTEIISINGVSIQSNDVKGSSTNLNIEKLQPGVYLVKVKSGNKVYTKRIVKS